MKTIKQKSAGLQRKNSDAIKKFQFRPGVSGNPSGRRKGSVSIAATLKKILTHADAAKIAKRLISAAKAGDLNAMRLLLDRVDGPQTGPLAMAIAQTAATAIAPDRVNITLVDNHRDVPPVSIVLPKGRMVLDEAQAAARQRQQQSGGGLPIGDPSAGRTVSQADDPVSELRKPQPEPESTLQQIARAERTQEKGIRRNGGLL